MAPAIQHVQATQLIEVSSPGAGDMAALRTIKMAEFYLNMWYMFWGQIK